MKVLNPSSIHAYRRSSDPTTIGYHMWPISWVSDVVQVRAIVPLASMATIGYSMPDTGPSTAEICG